MPYNGIEQLRKSGNLNEAYVQAQHILQQAHLFKPFPDATKNTNATGTNQEPHPETILIRSKRALAWVLHDLMKRHTDRKSVV